MATVRREVLIDTAVEDAWDALRDFHALHERVARGFVTACEPDGNARLVTLYDGLEIREVPVTIDDDRRRLVYMIEPGPLFTHYSAAVEITPDGEDQTRFVWTIDLLPDELVESIGERMDVGLEAIKETLGRDRAPAAEG
jgi:Polyketide cyclase / dehydrase and lipid transport